MPRLGRGRPQRRPLGLAVAVAAAPAVVQTISTFHNTGASISSKALAAPAGVTDGDFLFAVVNVGSTPTAFTTVPAGWTQMFAPTNDSNDSFFCCWYKTAAGEPGTYTWGWNAAAQPNMAIVRVSGVNTAAGPRVATLKLNGGTGASITPNAVSAVQPTELVFYVGVNGNDAAATHTVTDPGGVWTTDWNQGVDQTSPANKSTIIVHGTGQTGVPTFTASSGSAWWDAFGFALTPSGGAEPAVYQKTGGSGGQSAAGGAKTVTLSHGTGTTGLTYVEDVNAVVGTTSAVVGAFVATPADGDLAYCFVVNKPSTVTPTASAGWTQLATAVVGTGTDGLGTGPVRITMFTQTVSGAYLAPTITNAAGSVVAAGTLLLRPNPNTVITHATTSAQDVVDDATWSLTGATDLGIQDADHVITIDGWSNNISAAASAGDLTGPGITGFSTVTELTDTQLNVGNRGQMVANLFRDMIGTSSGVQTHSEVLNAAMTNRTGGTLFVRVRAQGADVVVSIKTGGGAPVGAPGGAKTVTPAATYVDTGTAAAAGAPGGAKAVQTPVTSTKAGTGAVVAVPGGAKTRTTAAIVTKAGTAAVAGAPGGVQARTTAATVTKVGTSAVVGAPGGAKTVVAGGTVIAKAGTSAAAAAAGGAKTVTAAAVVVKAGTSAGVAAAGGAKTLAPATTYTKTGVVARVGAPGGAKTVVLPAQVVKAGTGVAALAPGGGKVRTTAATYTKTGVAAAGVAAGGPKSVAGPGAIVKTGTSAAVGAPDGAATLTRARTGTAAAVAASGGARIVQHAKAGTAAAAAGPNGLRVVQHAKTGGSAAVGVTGGSSLVQSAGAIVKTGCAVAGTAAGGPVLILSGALYPSAATGTGWLNPANAQTADSLEATWTDPGAGATSPPLILSGYQVQSLIPSGASVQNVQITVRHSETAGVTAVSAQLFLGATPVGSPQPLTVAAGPHEDTVTVSGVAWADMGDVRVQIVGAR